MIYKIIQPSSHLKAFVKDYSLLHFTFAKNEPTPVKPFPANTQHCLVFYLRGSVTAFNAKSGTHNIFPRIAINGSQISRFDFHLSPHFLMLSVNFALDRKRHLFHTTLQKINRIFSCSAGVGVHYPKSAAVIHCRILIDASADLAYIHLHTFTWYVFGVAFEGQRLTVFLQELPIILF